MKNVRAAALVLGVVMALSVFSGCGGTKVGNQRGSEVKLNGDKIYPVQSEDTLTYWMQLNPGLSIEYTSFAETPIGQELEKKTGIKIEYVHPQSGQENEQFNIMLAGDDMTDLAQYSWHTYSGGPDKAIEDGYLLKLNDVIEEHAPNFFEYLKRNLDVDKKIKSDSGNYYTVPYIRGEEWLTSYQGLILRKDWLEQANLNVPKTLDEFENVLRVFKNSYSAGAPLILTSAQRFFVMYAHNIGDDFYLDKGIIKYGPAQPEYKDVLVTMNNWYNEGLLDKNMVSLDNQQIRAKMLNGEAGAMYGAVVGGIGVILNAKPGNVPSFDLVAAPQITKTPTVKPEFSAKEDMVNLVIGVGISGSCKNVELAARHLDYGFTEEGYMLYNFGIEGVSYNMVDGYPKLSELLTNNPDGMTLTALAPRYLRASYNGTFVQDERYVEQSFTYPEQQKNAYTQWANTNMSAHIIPPITLLAGELNDDASIMTNIKTYVDEMFVAFVTGKEPIDNFEKYIAQLESFGLERTISSRQSALERYNKR